MKTLTKSYQARVFIGIKSFALVFLVSACADLNMVTPLGPNASSLSSVNAQASNAWGPETPNFNLEAILRGEGNGFGLVKFRQPNDDQLVVYLDTWVRNLEPNTSYLLQRAVDTNLDGNCTGTAWLTLGKGMAPQAIVTDDTGTGSAELFRSVTAFPVGSAFEIHFRIVNASTMAVVLESDCYEYTISQ